MLTIAPVQRPKLNLQPRSMPKEEEAGSGGGGGGGGGGSGGGGGTSPAAAPSSGSRTSSIFGAAKPVDTAAKEREVEERLKKEEERLQRQLEDDRGRGPDRKMRDRSGTDMDGYKVKVHKKEIVGIFSWGFFKNLPFHCFQRPKLAH